MVDDVRTHKQILDIVGPKLPPACPWGRDGASARDGAGDAARGVAGADAAGAGGGGAALGRAEGEVCRGVAQAGGWVQSSKK